MSDLIDTTEMYLRTILELTEEGVLPMRARIAERLGQSGPTVSQTVARMQRDGLVELDLEDRHLMLTDRGAELATRVMRKHRLAECLLVDVIGLPWEEVHPEACRWEHVMSEAVERRLFDLLGQPTVSPFGNPIPGLSELVPAPAGAAAVADEAPGVAPAGPILAPLSGVPLSRIAEEGDPQLMTIQRIGEVLQSDEPLMARLRRVGVVPGGTVPVQRAGTHVRIGTEADVVELRLAQAAQVIVATTAQE